MRSSKSYVNHDCAPQDWKSTPDITGCFELDAMIVKTNNADMRDRLENHLVGDEAYKKRTPYSNSSGTD